MRGGKLGIKNKGKMESERREERKKERTEGMIKER